MRISRSTRKYALQYLWLWVLHCARGLRGEYREEVCLKKQIVGDQGVNVDIVTYEGGEVGKPEDEREKGEGGGRRSAQWTGDRE